MRYHVGKCGIGRARRRGQNEEPRATGATRGRGGSGLGGLEQTFPTDRHGGNNHHPRTSEPASSHGCVLDYDAFSSLARAIDIEVNVTKCSTVSDFANFTGNVLVRVDGAYVQRIRRLDALIINPLR